MNFELRPPFIIFHDNKPGQHATLFVNGKKAPFCNGMSSFNDEYQTYAWAFETHVKDGDIVTFATSDREIVGAVVGKEIVIHGHRPGTGDKPQVTTTSLDQILNPPYPPPRLRPMPLRRPR